MGKLIDLIGKRFGLLTVISRAENYIKPSGQVVAKWNCICDCGGSVTARSQELRKGDTKSCGCLKNMNLTGQIFGKLKVVDRAEDYICSNGNRISMWNCICDCEKATIKAILQSSLISGHTRSCGCLKKEYAENLRGERNKYDLTGEFGIGYTHEGIEFWFDKEDYDIISNHCWHVNEKGYLVAGFNDKNIRMHRLVMKPADDAHVDHKDHNTLDNRKTNLRIATPQQNSFNTQSVKRNTSGTIGVYWDKSKNKWLASIRFNDRQIYLGRFKDKDDAIKARKEAEEKYFGEWSYENSIKNK